MIRVYLIDDHQMVIDGISLHLRDNDKILIVGSSTDAHEGLEALDSTDVNIVLLDISMPDMDGLTCAELILRDDPDRAVIFLSTHLEPSIIKKAIKLGARGYVSKATGLDMLSQAIEKVYNGELYLAPEISSALLQQLLPMSSRKLTHGVIPKLTKREKEILELIAGEATTDEISKQLYISKNTVETHRKNLISKFQVRNSVGLVRSAIELGLLE